MLAVRNRKTSADLVCIVLGIASALLFASCVFAQVTTGTISGTVTDSTGAVLPGAKVVVLNQDTGASRTVQADAAGRYSAPSLSLGNYRVTVSQEGFQSETRSGIALTLGREAVVDFQLGVGAVTQTVEVTGEAPLVQTTEATVSYLVNDRTIRDLPLNGRDLSQLILLNPGVSNADNAKSGNAYVGFGKRISIGGMRGEDNAYLLDGTYVNDFERHVPAGPGGALLGVETVREFQVLTNSFSAAYGRVLGGVFNAVTKSGTNEFHGDVYEFLRNSALDARNFFDQQIPAFRRNQFGASAGGPIKKDRAFFYANYEGLRESLGTTQTDTVLTANARLGNLGTAGNVAVSPKIAPYLALIPLPTPGGRDFGDGTAQYIFQSPQPTHDNFGLARVDMQLSSSDSFFIRFTGSQTDRSQVNNFPAFLHLSGLSTRLSTLSETHIFSPRLLNAAHFAFNRVEPTDSGTYPSVPASLESVPGQGPAGFSLSGGLTSFEGFPKPSDRWTTNRFNYQDDINLTVASHSLQFGGMVERMQFNMVNANRPYGEWAFNSTANFLTGLPNRYRGTPPQLADYVRGMRQTFLALYLQDDWKMTPRLTLNLGVRWEPFTVPTEVNGKIINMRHVTDPQPTVGNPYWLNNSWKNVGPRFGFAWSPTSSGKSSVRGGIGLFFAPLDPSLYFTQITRSWPLAPEFDSPVTAATNKFPDALAQIAANQQSNPFGSTDAVPYNHPKTPHSLQYNLSLQQQLGGSNVLTVGYTGSRGINLSSYGNYNVPTATFDGTALAVAANATVVNPLFPNINYYMTNASSWYNALTANFRRQVSAGLQVTIAYTYSKSLAQADQNQSAQDVTGGNGASQLKYPYDMRVNKTLTGYDFRQLFTLNYSYDIPYSKGLTGPVNYLVSGWQLTGIVTLKTGQPFGPTTAVPTALSNLGIGVTTPNLAPGAKFSQIVKGGPNQYFNPAAFVPQSPLELGNVANNTLSGPGLATWDFGLTKNTSVTERFKVQFRAEMFNWLNRANFASPASQVFSGTGARVGSAGLITLTTTSSRQIQFGLKVLF